MVPVAAQVDGVAVSDSALDLSRPPYTIASAGARRFFAADALCERSTDHGGANTVLGYLYNCCAGTRSDHAGPRRGVKVRERNDDLLD